MLSSKCIFVAVPALGLLALSGGGTGTDIAPECQAAAANSSAEVLLKHLNIMLKIAVAESRDGRNDPKRRQDYANAFLSILMQPLDGEEVRVLLQFEAASRDEHVPEIVLLILQAKGVSQGSLLEAVLPELENPDNAMRDVVGRVLTEIELGPGGPCADFRYYRGHIENRARNGQSLEPRLIERMFALDSRQALLTFLDVFERDPDRKKPIWWADKMVSDNKWKRQHAFLPPRSIEPTTIEELEMLSQRPEWWIRLYIAEVWRENPEFCSPAVVERLKADKHPLVHKAMTIKDRRI